MNRFLVCWLGWGMGGAMWRYALSAQLMWIQEEGADEDGAEAEKTPLLRLSHTLHSNIWSALSDGALTFLFWPRKPLTFSNLLGCFFVQPAFLRRFWSILDGPWTQHRLRFDRQKAPVRASSPSPSSPADTFRFGPHHGSCRCRGGEDGRGQSQ